MAMNSMGYPVNYTKSTHICWGREVGVARNVIVEAAIKAEAKYLLFLDDDVMITPDLFVRLLSHQKDIVSGLYTTKSVPSYPLVFDSEGGGVFSKWKLGDLVKVWGCGMGATLINMRVFTEGKIEKPYFQTTRMQTCRDPETGTWYFRTGTEDLYFLDKVANAGYETYVDTSVQCFHMDRRSEKLYPLEGFEKWYRRKNWRT